VAASPDDRAAPAEPAHDAPRTSKPGGDKSNPQAESDKDAIRRNLSDKVDASKLDEIQETLAQLRKEFNQRDFTAERDNDLEDKDFANLTKNWIGAASDNAQVVTGTLVNIHLGSGGAAASAPIEEKRPSPSEWPSSAFDACGEDLGSVAFLLSAAVLEDSNIAHVHQSAEVLAQRLCANHATDPQSERPPARLRSVDSLFVAFRLTVSRETKDDGFPVDRVSFVNAGDSAILLMSAWTRMLGMSHWVRNLTEWLRDLGSSPSQEIRASAGRAAGLLWSFGVDRIEKEALDRWLTDSDLKPLDALDGAYSTAALSSAPFRQRINKRLRAWGHLSDGPDGVAALVHLSTRRYRHVDLDACLQGLEALLAQNNLAALLGAEQAYNRLLASAVDEPKLAAALTASLLKTFDKARQAKDEKLRIQVIMLSLSLVNAERRKQGERYQVLDRFFDDSKEGDGNFARLLHETMAASPLQAKAVQSLRQLFLRGAANYKGVRWRDSGVLRLFGLMYESGDARQRERLKYYLSDWINAAARKHPAAADGLDVFRNHLN